VAGVLQLTEDMADMGSADIFSLRYPNHPWSLALREIAQTILAVA
jgi:MinD-like ATPase involved in chromosome partitioning or flagellar assembly